MHEKQLRKLIDEGESVTLEFKSWSMCKNYNSVHNYNSSLHVDVSDLLEAGDLAIQHFGRFC